MCLSEPLFLWRQFLSGDSQDRWNERIPLSFKNSFNFFLNDLPSESERAIHVLSYQLIWEDNSLQRNSVKQFKKNALEIFFRE